MKYLIIIGMIVFLFGMGLAQTSLENIAISKAGDTVLVDIIVSKPVEYEHSITNTPPERIYIDLKNTVVDWTQKRFANLPMKTLKSVRTSQNRVEPEMITRVVLDVDRPVTYQVQDLPNGIRIKIPAIKGETAFATWQARGFKRVAETEVIKTPPIEKKSVVTENKIADPPAKMAEKPAKVEQLASTKEPMETKETQPAVKETPKADKKETTVSSAPAEEKPVEQPKVAAVVPPPPAKLGTEMEAVMKREVVDYAPGSERDPFKSLIGQSGNQVVSGKLPAIENLTLVGILEEDGGNQALFEDAEGNGYILRPNDPVRNGILVSVQKEKANFSITEYGWTRTVTLNLKLPELK
jgi:hypothetical protein